MSAPANRRRNVCASFEAVDSRHVARAARPSRRLLAQRAGGKTSAGELTVRREEPRVADSRRSPRWVDGGRTAWVAELASPEHRSHETFESVRDVVVGACRYCVGAFGIRRYIVDGYEVLTF